MIMYLLNKQQEIVKAIDEAIIEAHMTEEINVANKLDFSVMINNRIDDNIHYACIPAPRRDAFLMFKLTSEVVKSDRVEYTAVESAYDELKTYSYIKDIRPQERTAGEMVEQILQGTRWTLGYVAETGRQSTNFYYITVLEAIQKVVELFDVELTFDVNIDQRTNVISSRRINLYKQQGQRTGKRFEYGSNLLEVTREQSNEDLITALVGRGKGEEVSQGEDGSPDGYGRRITFADIEWKTANGNPTDKPKGQEYVEDKEATALYGFSDGKPRIGLTIFEDITDPQELLKATWASLQVAKRPKVSFKASVLDVGDLGLGDTVAIIRHDLGIEYFTRVYKVDHDLLDKNNNSIELGDDFSQKSLTNYVSNVAKITENAKNTAEYAVSAADGKNKNYYSDEKPVFANEGDNLFLDLGNGETEYYAWHNGNWELILSTVDTATVQKQVEQTQVELAQIQVQTEKLANTQTESVKRLDEQVQELKTKTLDNANDVANVFRDVTQAHNEIGLVKQSTNELSDKLAAKVDDTEYQSFKTQTAKELSEKVVASDLSNYATTTDVKLTADGLKEQYNSVKGKLDNLKIGGKNLLDNSDGKFVMGYGIANTVWENSKTILKYKNAEEVSIAGEILPQKADFITQYPVNTGDQLTQSIFVETDADINMNGGFQFTWFNTKDGHKYVQANIDKVGTKTYRLWCSHTWDGSDNATFRVMDIQNLYKVILFRTSGTYIAFYHPQIEKGTIPTDWSLSANDVTNKITEVSQDLTTYKGIVDRDYAKLSSVYTKNEVINLTNDSKNGAVDIIKSDSNWQSLVKVNTNASFLQTPNGFAQEVVKTTTPMVEGGGVNLCKNTSNTLTKAEVWDRWLYIGLNNSTSFDSLSKYQGKRITVRVWIEKPTADARVQIWTNKGSVYGNWIKAGESGYSTVSGVIPTGFTNWNIPIGGGADHISFSYKEFKIEQGSIATPWTPAPEDLATQTQLNKVIDTADSHTRTISDYLTGSNSRFTQLSNSVNLKVNKGDVIGQINLEAGRTLLQNKKIYLDADSVTFSGKAFIPDAAITSISADKIKAGTLDAGLINVVNINANNIVSGAIKGANLDINLTSGNVSFRKGRIHNLDDTVDINLDEKYIAISDASTKVLLKNGRLLLTQPSLWDESTDPYLTIYNGDRIKEGANIKARYALCLTDSSSASYTPDFQVGNFQFSGFYVGQNLDNWIPTVVGGYNRGVLISGGWGNTDALKIVGSPYILVGSNSQGQAPYSSGWHDASRIYLSANFVHIPSAQRQTTGSSANVFVASDGALLRSTSATKYKKQIVRLDDDFYGQKLLQVKTATWLDKAEVEKGKDINNDAIPTPYFGMIAEDLADAGLDIFVQRGEKGEIEGINYDRIGVALIPVVKKLQEKIEKLEKLLNGK